MKLEFALYHLLLDRARSVRVDASPDMREFLDEVAESLSVVHRRNFFSLTWKYRGAEYGPLQIPSEKFEFYIRADTKTAANRLRTDGSYRAQNWTQATDVLGLMAEASGVGRGLQALPSMPVVLAHAGTPMLKCLDLLGVVPLCIGAGVAAWLLMNLQAGVYTAILVLGLLLLSERLADAHLNRPPSWVEKMLISLGALLPAALGAHPAILVTQIVPLVILSYLEKRRSTSVLWVLPGASLIFSGLYSWQIFIPYALAFFVSSVIWTILVQSRLTENAGRMLIAGTIAGGIAGAVANYAVPVAYDDSMTAAAAAFWPVVIAFAFFLAGVSLLWVHGSQYSLIPWTVCFCLMAAIASSLFSGISSAAMTGSIGMGLVIAVRVLSAAWQSRQKSIIRG